MMEPPDTDEKKPPEWLTDPEMIVFAGGEELAVGASRPHALSDVIGGLFARSRQDVREDWDRVQDQIRYILELSKTGVGSFELQEVSFELGFSAEGQIVFVAKGGVKTTVRATFKRKLNDGSPTINQSS